MWVIMVLCLVLGVVPRVDAAGTLDIGITGDDYLWMTTFQEHAERVAGRMVAHEPMASNKARIRFFIVPTQRDLYCGRTSTISRLATCNRAIARDVFTQAGYNPDIIVVLWNNGTYSGSGGSDTCVSYNGSQILDVAEHECVGHGVGRLVDSYKLYAAAAVNSNAYYQNCWKGVAPPPGTTGWLKECNRPNFWREGNDCMRRLPCDKFLPRSQALILMGINRECQD